LYSCYFLCFTVATIYAAPFAVYTLSVGSPNFLNIFAGNPSGNVSYQTQINTGGNGAGVQSQGSVFAYMTNIFSVNSLSNTVSMFSTSAQDPTQVTLVGTASTGGDWPLSVTACNNIACVVTSGVSNILRCYTFNSTGLYVIATSDRSLGLSLTNPPISHTGPGQVSFTPDCKALVITVKTATPPVMAYSIDSNGNTGANPVQSTVMGMVPFAFVFDTDGSIVLVDAGPTGTYSGIIDLTITTNPSALAVSFLTTNYYLIVNQSASCWISRDSQSEDFFVANAGSKMITQISRSTTTFTVINEYNIGLGITDNTVGTVGSNNFLYQLSGGGLEIIVLQIPTQTIQQKATTPTGTQGGIAFIQASASSQNSASAAVVPNAVLGLALLYLVLLMF